MTLISQAELEHFVRPLSPDSDVDLKALFMAATFSQLCEPGDKAFAILTGFFEGTQLLESLVAREDWQKVANRLGNKRVQELEGELSQPLESLWKDCCQRWLPRLSKTEVLASLDQGKALGIKLVSSDSDFYPVGFHSLMDAKPAVLWVLGDPGILSNPRMISIVGSRNTSSYGRGVATDLALVASDSQIVTVSGGAFGIDATVHQATLAAGGQTIAAMAGGLARLYPAANHELLKSVARTGAVISELPPSVAPAKWRFLMRNRLIAALGKATVVVQAGLKSGSINTANRASELGRRVAVVPGPINSAYSIGCHNLVNQKLGLIEVLSSVHQLPDLLNPVIDAKELPPGLGVLETRMLDAFGTGVNYLPELLKESGLTSSEAFLALGSLELEGLTERVGAGYRRVAK